MALLSRTSSPLTVHLLVLLLCMSLSFRKGSSTSSDHDHKVVQQKLQQADDDHAGIKCGSCPCVNPCAQEQQLSPPPPPPSPPPPPPPPKNCNPSPLTPPPPRFIYVTGIPGVYQTTDQNSWQYYYSGGGRNVAVAGSKLIIVVLQLIILFGRL